MAAALNLPQLDHQAQGIIHGFIIAEGLSDIRVQQNKIGAGVVALGVFAAYSSLEQATQIVLQA